MQKRPYLILVLLAVVFILPGLAAITLFQHPEWVKLGTTNKGQLLEKARLTGIKASKKWRLVLWQPNICDEACRQEIDTLARIRLSLGRRLYQVEVLLLLGEKVSGLPTDFRAYLKEADIETKRIGKFLTNEPKIFLANPEAYLVLAYPLSTKPTDILQDLQHLLQGDNKNV